MGQSTGIARRAKSRAALAGPFMLPEVKQLFTSLYHWFSEGFDLPDLLAARIHSIDVSSALPNGCQRFANALFAIVG